MRIYFNIIIQLMLKNIFDFFKKKEERPVLEYNGITITDNSLVAFSLSKRYGKKEAVKSVDFFMFPGEIVGFLGPNGAGKTTTFYMIAGFVSPSSGKIFLNRRDITKYPMYKRSRIGIAYLPQETSVFRKLSIEENIKAVLETRADLNSKESAEKLEGLLVDLGIENKRKQKAYTLSGGERRRTEIARALATNPKYLLLDEPFAGIDPIAIYEIKEIIKSLSKKNIGILITDHNVRETLEITTRSYILADGNIALSGTREEIVDNEFAKQIYLGQNFKL